jgi:SRSO17 transposase
LPEEWISDEARREEAEIPEDVGFRTKPEIALERIRCAAQGPLPFGWVSGDERYGQPGYFRDGLDDLDLQFVLEVPCTTKVWTEMPPLLGPEDWQGDGRPPTGWRLSPDAPSPRRAEELIDEATDWRKITVRQGTKKPIRSAWAAFRVYPWRDGLPGDERWLLIEHEGGDQYKYYLSNAGPDTALERMAQVAKQEWFVEQCFREAKDEIGLDEFEVRKWRGWHHHMTMCMLAHSFVAILRHRWKKGDIN